MAANLHWPERDILALRWDRATAYLDEISVDLGETPNRPTPDLPEEKALAGIMQAELDARIRSRSAPSDKSDNNRKEQQKWLKM